MKKLISALLILVAITLSSPQPTQAATDIVNDATLSTSLVACYDLDETSGTRADAGSGGYDLTDNNTVGFATGIVSGNAADFERTNAEYLSKADAGAGDPFDLGGDFSIAFWWTPESEGVTQRLFTKDDGAGTDNSRAWSLYANADDTLQVFYRSATGVNSIITTNADQVTAATTRFYAVSVDVSTASTTFWVNGSIVADTVNASAATSIWDSATAFKIGQLEGGNEVDGVIDVAAVWTKLLDASQISALYNSGTGIPCGTAAAPTVTPQPIIWFD